MKIKQELRNDAISGAFDLIHDMKKIRNFTKLGALDNEIEM